MNYSIRTPGAHHGGVLPSLHNTMPASGPNSATRLTRLVTTLFDRGPTWESSAIREVLDAIPDAITIRDSNGIVLFCNQAFTVLTGLARENTVGQREEDVLPGAMVHAVSGNGAPGSLSMADGHEKEILHLPGGEKIFDTTSMALQDSEGRFCCYFTLRRQQPQASFSAELRRDQEFLQELLDYSGEVFYRFKLIDGTCEYLSAAFGKILGYSREESLRLSLDGKASLVHPDYQKAYRQHLDLLYHGVTAAPAPPLEYPLRSSQGGYQWFSDTMHLIRDTGGRVTCLSGRMRAISDEKERTRTAQTSHRQMLSLLDNLDALAYVVDPATRRILFLNRAMKNSYGSNLEGQVCWMVLGNAQAPCPACTMPDLLSTGLRGDEVIKWEGPHPLSDQPAMHIDRLIRWIDGSRVWLQITFPGRAQEERKLPAAGESTGQFNRMQGLSRMAGAAVHHFKNQLTIILGCLELALDDSGISPRTQKQLASALLAAKKTSDISNLLQQYLGLETIKETVVDLAETCRQNLPVLQALIPSGIVLETEIDSSPVPVKADPDLLVQTLNHLLINARENLQEQHGRIALSVQVLATEDIPPGAMEPGDWYPAGGMAVCLEVRNNGETDGECANTLFNPFINCQWSGSNFRLAMVLALIKTWGGAMQADRSEQGTALRILLPLMEEKNPAREGSGNVVYPERNGPQKGLTILLVDDNVLVLDVGSLLLANLGYTVLTAVDGEEALQIFHQHQSSISLVFCDLFMPRMDGWQTLAALRAIDPAIPFIMVSGNEPGLPVNPDQTEKPQAFLYKPYTTDALRETIRQVMGRPASSLSPSSLTAESVKR